MSTFPRSKVKPVPAPVGLEFDSGINASTAWTEHLVSASEQGAELGTGHIRERVHHEQEASQSDDDDTELRKTVSAPKDGHRRARALYPFEGKPEFGEIKLRAGDELLVMKEDVGDGWSFVESSGESGLLPRSYYTYISNFSQTIEALRDSITPRNSTSAAPAATTSSTTLAPLEPQTTGSYFPNFRQSLLGGRSLNRFSSFVTSGAEDWVINGCSDPLSDVESSDHASDDTEVERDAEDINGSSENSKQKQHLHFVDAGPIWREKIPAFRVMVHSPYKRSSTLSGAYTMYQVTSIFDSTVVPSEQTSITVHRRFSHFVSLHTAVSRRLPGIAISPLPGKQYSGRFSDEFIEARRTDLERYLSRLVRHPVARYAEVLTFFLSCETEAEWQKSMPNHLKLPPAGPGFYARVYHPSFNFDLEDASEEVERFSQHISAIGKSVQWLRGVFGKFRTVRAEEASSLRLLSYSLLGLLTSQPLDSNSKTLYGVEEEDERENEIAGKKGLLNNQNAWCWRDNCEGCLGFSKAMQRTAEALQHIADLYDNNARLRLFGLHEHVKDLAHPRSLYDPIVETHRTTLKRYQSFRNATDNDGKDDILARCETVLNTTMAEFETYHTQKREDFQRLMVDYLENEIDMHEQAVARLKACRMLYDDDSIAGLADTGPRQPSIFEKDLGNPHLSSPPLPQPCPHVFDSVPMRPVSAAVQEGVGMLFGNAVSGRSSVFAKFW